jgi:hypothetical protein
MVNTRKSNGQAAAQRKTRNKESGKNSKLCSGYLSKTAAKVSPISHFSDRYHIKLEYVHDGPTLVGCLMTSNHPAKDEGSGNDAGCLVYGQLF